MGSAKKSRRLPRVLGARPRGAPALRSPTLAACVLCRLGGRSEVEMMRGASGPLRALAEDAMYSP